jgi:hypothetical protein
MPSLDALKQLDSDTAAATPGGRSPSEAAE